MRSIQKYQGTRVVDLMLTYDCNAHCPYCFVRDRGAQVVMTPGILDRSIDWIAETADGPVEIVFLGGEPTLEPLLIERTVRRCRDWENRTGLSFTFGMTTNFIEMSDQLAGNLARWGVRYMVSVDGAGKRHDQSKPVKGLDSPFEVIKQNLKKCREYQPAMTARVTVLPRNVDWLSEDLETLHDLGIDAFLIAPASGIKWPEEKIEIFVSQLQSYAKERKIVDGKPIPMISSLDEEEIKRPHWGCGAGKGRYCIDPMGQIFGCARFAGIDGKRSYKLGDVYAGIEPSGDIREFYNTDYTERPECSECEMKDECLGG